MYYLHCKLQTWNTFHSFPLSTNLFFASPSRLIKEKGELLVGWTVILSDPCAATTSYLLSCLYSSVPNNDWLFFSHVASMHGHLHCVKFLLRQPGVDIHARDRWRASPLSGKNRCYVYRSGEIFLSANELRYADLGVPANSRPISLLGFTYFWCFKMWNITEKNSGKGWHSIMLSYENYMWTENRAVCHFYRDQTAKHREKPNNNGLILTWGTSEKVYHTACKGQESLLPVHYPTRLVNQSHERVEALQTTVSSHGWCLLV